MNRAPIANTLMAAEMEIGGVPLPPSSSQSLSRDSQALELSTRNLNPTALSLSKHNLLTHSHSHEFLGSSHDSFERRTWAVIVLCAACMIVEITGGTIFGSLALIADGIHMGTHVIAFLIAGSAYTLSRKYVDDRRFSFGTGKFGDLAGFSSAIILAIISILIAYEAISRLVKPSVIHYGSAIPIAAAGLAVNLLSGLLLGHHHGGEEHADESRTFPTDLGLVVMEIFEDGIPPVFRVSFKDWDSEIPAASSILVQTIREGGATQDFTFSHVEGQMFQSVDEIPEPHEFRVRVKVDEDKMNLLDMTVTFEENHDHHHHDQNMRGAILHVAADAAVSTLVLVALIIGRAFSLSWLDSSVGLLGTIVIASWAFGLARAASRNLLDMTPSLAIVQDMLSAIESLGDTVSDLHVWRLGPGHLGAILSIVTSSDRGRDFYRKRLAHIPMLSHLTIEVVVEVTAIEA